MDLYSLHKGELVKIVEKDGNCYTYKLKNITISPSNEIEFNWETDQKNVSPIDMFQTFHKDRMFSLSPHVYVDKIMEQIKSKSDSAVRHQIDNYLHAPANLLGFKYADQQSHTNK